jgi:lauroyl/myristoyl acyltransferase
MIYQDKLRLAFLMPLLARLPSRLAYPLAARLGAWGREGQANAALAVSNGLLHMWPELAGRPERLAEIKAGWLAMMAREMLDVYRMGRKGHAEVDTLVQIQDLGPLFDARATGKGVILVMAHYSRLIMLLSALGSAGVRMSMLTMPVDDRNPELDPVMRRYLQLKVRRLRQRIGGAWLSVGDNLRPMYTGLKAGEVWIVLIDAYMSHQHEQRGAYPFLGGTLSLSEGIIRIARTTRSELVYASVQEDGHRLNGRLQWLQASDAVTAFSAALTELERDVQVRPDQWWQWNILEHIWTAQERA